MTLHAIVPAGGAGTRLWPLSRQGHPKFLHDLTGSGRSLLQATVDRLRPLAQSVVVVTGQAHAQAVRDQLPELPRSAVLAEPSPRDSMAAIGLAAAVLVRRHPGTDVVIGSFAADHVIADTAAFEQAVRDAHEAALGGYVVTLGIRPTQPSTAFGYIELGEPLESGARAHRVLAFTEKPEAEVAQAYLATGRYRWNAGMFVCRAEVLLGHLQRHHPVLAEGIETIASAWDTTERESVLDQLWPGLTKIAIDHAIAEPVAAAGGVAVVPAEFDWDDVGDWASLRALLGTSEDAAVLGPQDRALAWDAPGAMLVPGAGRTLVVLGIPGAVAIDTPDAVLLTTTARAQEVKDIVAHLRENRGDLL